MAFEPTTARKVEDPEVEINCLHGKSRCVAI